MCCAVLCCAVLCCAVLCCAVLCCAALRCPARAAMCCAVLRCAALCCAVLCCVVGACGRRTWVSASALAPLLPACALPWACTWAPGWLRSPACARWHHRACSNSRLGCQPVPLRARIASRRRSTHSLDAAGAALQRKKCKSDMPWAAGNRGLRACSLPVQQHILHILQQLLVHQLILVLNHLQAGSAKAISSARITQLC